MMRTQLSVVNGARRPGRPVVKDGPGEWFRFVNKADNSADIYIFDDIGWYGVTAQDFVKELSEVKGSTITVHINCLGGDVYDGIAIFNALRNHKARIEVVVEAIAASAASFIAMAGDSVTMAFGSQLMIHDALTMAFGNAADLADVIKMLDKTSDTIAAFYAAKAGGDVPAWRALMRAETWYDADEAVAARLADKALDGPTATETEEDEELAARMHARGDLTIFNHAGREAAPAPVLDVPEAIASGNNPQPVDEVVDEAPILAFDLDAEVFRTSVTAGLEAPTVDADFFRAAVALAVNDAPAPPPSSEPAPPAGESTPFASFDREAFKRSVREAAL